MSYQLTYHELPRKLNGEPLTIKLETVVDGEDPIITFFSNDFPHVINIRARMVEGFKRERILTEWCDENFGARYDNLLNPSGRWVVYGTIYYFKDKEDALFMKLVQG